MAENILGEANVLLRAKNKELKADLAQAKKSVQSSTSAAEKNFNSLGKTMAKVGLAVAGAFAVKAIKDFASSSVEAFNIQAEAESKLRAVIRATGGAAEKTAEQLFKEASALQELTIFGDEAIINTQALIATFKNIKGDEFTRVTAAAADMAAVMGTDLKSAAIQLGKALNDPDTQLSALSRTGVTFSEAQKEVVKAMVAAGDMAGAQQLILAELESQFGGAAEAAAQTFGGALTQLKNLFGDIQEVVGSLLADAFTPLVKMLTEMAKETLTTKSGLEGLRTTVLAAIEVAVAFAQVMNGLKLAYDLFTNSIRLAVDVISSGFLSVIEASATSVEGLLSALSAIPGVGSVFDTALNRVTKFRTEITHLRKAVVESGKETVANYKKVVAAAVDKEWTIQRLAKKTENAVKKSAINTGKNLKKTTGEIKKVGNALKDITGDKYEIDISIPPDALDSLDYADKQLAETAKKTANIFDPKIFKEFADSATDASKQLAPVLADAIMSGDMDQLGQDVGSMLGKTAGEGLAMMIPGIGPMLAPIMGELGSSLFGSLFGGGEDVPSIFEEFAAGDLADILSTTTALVEDANRALENLEMTIGQLDPDPFDAVVTQIQQMAESTELMNDLFGTQNGVLDENAQAFIDVVDAAVAYNEALKEMGLNHQLVEQEAANLVQTSTEFALQMIEGANVTNASVEAAIGLGTAAAAYNNELGLAIQKMSEYIPLIAELDQRSRGLAQATAAMEAAQSILNNAQLFGADTVQSAAQANAELTAIQERQTQIVEQLSNAHNLSTAEVAALQQELIDLNNAAIAIEEDLTGYSDAVEANTAATEDNEEAQTTQEKQLAIMNKAFVDLQKVVRDLLGSIEDLTDGIKNIPANKRTTITTRYLTEGDPPGSSGSSHNTRLAKGGIVDRPTFVGFSGGRGAIAGEAGPEAVLPLQRDSKGNLGVSGGGGVNVNITVEGSFVGNESTFQQFAEDIGIRIKDKISEGALPAFV